MFLPVMSHRYSTAADNSHKAQVWADVANRSAWNGATRDDAIAEANAEVAALNEARQRSA